MMDFESIVERAALDGASTVTMEDMTSQFPAHRPRSASQIERFALSTDPDQVDRPVTDDLLETARSQTSDLPERKDRTLRRFRLPSRHRPPPPRRSVRLPRRVRSDRDCPDRSQPKQVHDVPPPPVSDVSGDDLVGFLIDRLLHYPGIQSGKLTPIRGRQLIGMTEMQKSIPGLPFPFPGQLL